MYIIFIRLGKNVIKSFRNREENSLLHSQTESLST